MKKILKFLFILKRKYKEFKKKVIEFIADILASENNQNNLILELETIINNSKYGISNEFVKEILYTLSKSKWNDITKEKIDKALLILFDDKEYKLCTLKNHCDYSLHKHKITTDSENININKEENTQNNKNIKE